MRTLAVATFLAAFLALYPFGREVYTVVRDAPLGMAQMALAGVLHPGSK